MEKGPNNTRSSLALVNKRKKSQQNRSNILYITSNKMSLSTFINFSLIYIEGPYRPKGSGFYVKIFWKES